MKSFFFLHFSFIVVIQCVYIDNGCLMLLAADSFMLLSVHCHSLVGHWRLFFSIRFNGRPSENCFWHHKYSRIFCNCFFFSSVRQVVSRKSTTWASLIHDAYTVHILVYLCVCVFKFKWLLTNQHMKWNATTPLDRLHSEKARDKKRIIINKNINKLIAFRRESSNEWMNEWTNHEHFHELW